MKNTALVIIDVQKAMFMEQEKPCRGEETVGNIKRLLLKAREMKIPVVFVQHEDEYMQHGSKGWQVHDALSPLDSEPRAYKKTRDSFFQTELDAILKRLHADTLILCGMQTEYCVATTCLRANTMGYKGYLATDGHTTFDSPVLPAEKIIAHYNHVLPSELLAPKTTLELLAIMEA